jgi:predicted ATP-grasp superfamily ATP-dependent carboligase
LKNDIRVAYSANELDEIKDKIFENTNKVIIQEFIENCDNELNILGCAMDDGHCVIPCCIKKIRIHPKSRGSVSVAKIGPIEKQHKGIYQSIEKFIRKIGYIGLFSIELMNVSSKNKTYFIEANFRNDALNPFVEKMGVNLPLLHVQNLLGEDLNESKPVNKKMKMICEPIHSASLYHHSINVFQWLFDIITSDGFMLYYKEDKTLFWSQYVDKFKSLFR